MLTQRHAGVLLHARSLPSGDFGDATRFLRFLASAGFRCWQLLPLGPSGAGHSPYSPLSAFAGDPGLVPAPQRAEPVSRESLGRFIEREQDWLRDYALFMVIRARQDKRPWWQWPEPLRQRDRAALRKVEQGEAKLLTAVMRDQVRFERAWQALRAQAVALGIDLFGDLPMFVMADSADAWSRPELFRLGPEGLPTHLAGVPPDAFTDRGQCWNCPVYHWPAMQNDGFGWWRRRFRHELRRFDLLRWDHFRGLLEGWEIPVPAGDDTPDPRSGAWRKVPGRALLRQLAERHRPLPVVAENLGIITPAVEELRRAFGLPGMHVLQFAFDGNADNPHLPGLHEEQGVAYCGTHDNDTALGWASGLDEAMRLRVAETLGIPTKDLAGGTLRATLDSTSCLAVLTMQDLLGLGSAARLNTPGQADGQWRWRFSWEQVSSDLARSWAGAVVRADRQPA
ncbi:MAG: 4-alpha-glucanotransferase [Xanthomonadales bacterium]|nr:4-alpha-glucanotransferase [Xanthomonadales bacterium]